MIKYSTITNKKRNKIKIPRNFDTLNRFLNGVIMTKISPIKLLIKKRG